MTETLKPDICVIGAGAGGLTVAAAAAAFGVSVVLVEKAEMGGDCLNHGCVPSKALIAAARAAQAQRHPDVAAVAAIEPSVDFGAVSKHIQSVIASIAPNDSEARFTALGVGVVRAPARFIDRRTVEAGRYLIRARRFVIAAGSSPAVPPIPGIETVDVLTNETIFSLQSAPSHLVIVGGGPIGIELAQAHRRLGCEVTVIEAARALGREDPELAAIALERLRAEGVTVLERTAVTQISRHGRAGVRVHVDGEGGAKTIDGSHLLVAAGRRPNTADLGLDAARIRHDARGIVVGRSLRSSNRRVYAIGDIAGSAQFTHVASWHAGLVLRAILFRLPVRADLAGIPRVTFCEPEIASIGMTEQDAIGSRRPIRILRWPYSENDRAQADGCTDGLIKLVVDTKGRILGAGIVGAHAGELIGLWSLAIAKRLTVRDIAAHVAPYPTLSEISRRAAITFYADLPHRPMLRRLVRMLAAFG